MPGTWYANSHHRYKFLDFHLARFPQAKNLLLSAYMERELEEQEEILNEKLHPAEIQQKFQPLISQVVEVGFPFDGTSGQS